MLEDQINPLHQAAMKQARTHWNQIAKPLHSLGLLEDMVVQMAGITETAEVRMDKRAVIVMCADNGVVTEGVTQSDSSVTAIVAEAMCRGDGNINNLARTYGADVKVIDIGMQTDVETNGSKYDKVAYGTRNLAQEAAMTEDQASHAIAIGIYHVSHCKREGYQILVTGEMGIGNTTTSSAIASVLLGRSPAEVTGRGAGLDDAGWKRKVEIITRALARKPLSKERPMELLAEVGGLDIAGLVGVFLGGGMYRIPVVIDGFIATVAAALAVQLVPQVKDYMLCSHVSEEPAAKELLASLGLRPVITAGLCLGEGTGGVMLLPLLDGALALYHSDHSFAGLQMEPYEEKK